MQCDEKIRHEIAENMRFYGNMRFKQLTLLMAWLPFAGYGYLKYGMCDIGPLKVNQIIAFWSLFFVAVLWIMEMRSTLSWCAHRDVAPELWPRPENEKVCRCIRFIRHFNATNSVMIFPRKSGHTVKRHFVPLQNQEATCSRV